MVSSFHNFLVWKLWWKTWTYFRNSNTSYSLHCNQIASQPMNSHRIGFQDITDLWVVKIKKLIILRTHSTSSQVNTEHKLQISTKNMWKDCLFNSQKNKIIEYGGHIFEKFSWCAKVSGLIFLMVLFESWLAEQLITWMRSTEGRALR